VNINAAPDSKIQIFPPAANGGDRGPGGYQTIGTPTGVLSLTLFLFLI
jgi:hypothetical protein